jgi:hypothetical protein
VSERNDRRSESVRQSSTVYSVQEQVMQDVDITGMRALLSMQVSAMSPLLNLPATPASNARYISSKQSATDSQGRCRQLEMHSSAAKL